MAKSKSTKKNLDISPERLAELRRATLVASTGAFTRLAGSKVTDEEVEQIMNALSKSSGQR